MRKKCGILCLIAILLIDTIPIQAKEGGASGENEKPVTLRICNWEEYIDLGEWDEEETIDLESGDVFGENSMLEDFEKWYQQTYGREVKVEYSTFGTNEDLYNMLTLGDVYDLVCPSEYMIMKLMAEDQLLPLSETFFDTSVEENYYAKGISPYIDRIFQENQINGKSWKKYMAGYMWGITGIVYNPEVVSQKDASTWDVLNNSKYKRQVTLKDNVRDSYFAAVGAVKADLLTSEAFVSDEEYHEKLKEEMNDTSPKTVEQVEAYLQKVKDNAYSFETDSGKADMITGKVVANYQWSGDAVYTLDQADEDDYTLNFAVPVESTNIYFDGWVMLKKGIDQDPAKQHAAEAFMNYISRADNVIRNMYYVGYTSVISGGEDTRIFEYADWCYGAEEEEAQVKEYPLGYFFSGNDRDEDYVLLVTEEQTNRQLFAQYPTEDVIERASIMTYFDEETNDRINQMWIHVRCFNIKEIPLWILCLSGILFLAILIRMIWEKKKKQEL